LEERVEEAHSLTIRPSAIGPSGVSCQGIRHQGRARVEVLFTIAVVIALGAWVSAVYTRLARLRKQVTQAWERLKVDTSNPAVRTVYNKHVDLYNAALGAFPANLVGPAAGF